MCLVDEQFINLQPFFRFLQVALRRNDIQTLHGSIPKAATSRSDGDHTEW
jgi:hypothetical protein